MNMLGGYNGERSRLSLAGLIGAIVGSFFLVSFVEAQKGTVISNTTENPVRVKAVDNPAHQPYRIGVSLQETATVPAGKIFVIEHLSGRLMVESNAGATGPCRIHYLAFGSGGEPIDVIPVYMGSAQGLNTEFSFFSFSQPIKSYAGPNSDVGGATAGLSMHCKSFPVFDSRIVFSGYLVDVSN